MKSKLKKSLSLLLALVMAMSCMSMGAFAATVNATDDETANTSGAVASATVGSTKTYYTSLMEAINAAYNGGTVELLSDVTVPHWHQNIWTLEAGEGHWYDGYPNSDCVRNPTVGPNNLTINGNGYTLTISAIDSLGNGGYMFSGATNLHISGLKLTAPVGFGLNSGVIENVKFTTTQAGDTIYSAIYLGRNSGSGDDRIIIRGCTFYGPNNVYAIYCDPENSDNYNTLISQNDFHTTRAVPIYTQCHSLEFSNNIVDGAKGLQVVRANAKVTGNYFTSKCEERSISIYPSSGAVFEDNVIYGPIELKSGATPDLSKNYWANGAEPKNLPEGVICNSYYTAMTDNHPSVGANFTLSNPVNVGGETETTFVGNTDEAIRTQLGNSDAIIVTPDTTAADYNPDKTYVAYKDSDENLVKATLDVNIVEATTGIESTLDASDAQVTALNNAAANAGEQIEKSQINIAKYAKDFNVSSGTLDFGYSMTLKTSATNSVKFDIKPTVKVGNAAAVELGSDYVNQSTGMTVLMPIPSDWANAKVLHYKDDSTTEAMAGVEIVTVDNAKYAKFQAKSFSDYEAQKDAPYVGYVKSIGANVGNTIYLNVRMVFTNPQSGMKLKYEVGGNAAKYYALPTAASDGSYQFQIPVIAKYFGVKGTISIVNSDDTETYYISKGEAGEHVTSVQYSVYDYLDLLETSNVASSWLELSTAIRNLGNASARHWGDTYNQSMQDVSWIAYPAN